ncbi:MAG: phosphoribosylamine--glycine ligase [bacterium]|nr:phosphoribosylamine--glycine ligase [bacterium]
MKKALLIGNGAREHAIAEALVKGGAELYVFMSAKNPGIAKLAAGFEIGNPEDAAAVKEYAEKIKPDFAFVGPEAPLGAGVVDELEKAGFGCVGPKKVLAQLETSKSFTREVVARHNIPGNPLFKIFESMDGVKEYLEELKDYVLKPDGLTGGKGVKVFGEHIQNNDEAIAYCEEVIGQHGKVVVEERLEGEEFSLQSFTDGKTTADCVPVQDHKRAFDNDEGPNTGGMGSYSCADHLMPFITKEDFDEASEITKQVMAALTKDYGSFKGIMYGGFIVTKTGVKLIEYNARLGDPEAMNVLAIMKTNFVDLCEAIVNEKLSDINLEFEDKATVCKYIVPKGYPTNPKPGKIVVPDVKAKVYYAAVEEKDGEIFMTKSRAAGVVGIADDMDAAEQIAEEAAQKIEGNVFHRKDIGTQKILQKRIDHMKSIRG